MTPDVQDNSCQFAGFARCVQRLADVVSQPENLAALEKELREACEKDPESHFRAVIYPMLPAEVKREINDKRGSIDWSRLIGDVTLQGPAHT